MDKRSTQIRQGARYLMTWVTSGKIHELEKAVTCFQVLLADEQRKNFEKEHGKY